MKFRIKVAPLPLAFRGTPQDFVDSFFEGLEISTDAQGFSTSATEPVGNVGPWFKNGRDVYIWDEDTSAYTPLDVSTSLPPQIVAQETEPDSSQFTLWLKLDGSTVVGLYAYYGGQWVAEQTGIPDFSIGTVQLANGAVTGRKVKPQAVTAAKLSSGLEFSLWEKGSAGDFLRVDDSGQRWRFETIYRVAEVSIPEFDYYTNRYLAIPHGLSGPPSQVQVTIVNASGADYDGITAGSEVILPGSFPVVFGLEDMLIDFWALGNRPQYPGVPVLYATNIGGSAVNLDLSVWKLRVYYTAP